MDDDYVAPQPRSHDLGFNSSSLGPSTDSTENDFPEAFKLGNTGVEAVQRDSSGHATLIGKEDDRREDNNITKVVAAAKTKMRKDSPHWLEQMTKYGIVDWSFSRRNSNMVRDILENLQPETLRGMKAEAVCNTLQRLQGNVWYVDAAQLLLARQCGIISTLPKITVEQLKDRSKSDALIICLAVLQVLSFWLQLIVRAAQGTTSSPLEITTLSLAICTFVIYVLLWNKPKDIATPIHVSAARYPEAHELSDLALSSIIHNDSSTPAFSRYRTLSSSQTSAIYIAPLLGLVFGCLHCIVWNFVYPTVIEQRLWQASSLAIITSSALLYLVYSLMAEDLPPKLYFVIMGFIVMLYTTARCFILIESIRSLAYLPPDAFFATWASNMPAIS